MEKIDVKCDSCGELNHKNASNCIKCGKEINVIRRAENKLIYLAIIECIFMGVIKIFEVLASSLYSGLSSILPTIFLFIIDKFIFAFGLAIIIKWIFSKKKGFTRIPLFIIYIILFILFTISDWYLILIVI